MTQRRDWQKGFFTAADFVNDTSFQKSADTANAILREELAKVKRVYGCYIPWTEDGINWYWCDGERDDEHTHEALVIDIKELPK